MVQALDLDLDQAEQYYSVYIVMLQSLKLKNEGISIGPRKIYHPSYSMLVLHCLRSILLAQVENIEFNEYRPWKKERNEPLESNPIVKTQT